MFYLKTERRRKMGTVKKDDQQDSPDATNSLEDYSTKRIDAYDDFICHIFYATGYGCKVWLLTRGGK